MSDWEHPVESTISETLFSIMQVSEKHLPQHLSSPQQHVHSLSLIKHIIILSRVLSPKTNSKRAILLIVWILTRNFFIIVIIWIVVHIVNKFFCNSTLVDFWSIKNRIKKFSKFMAQNSSKNMLYKCKKQKKNSPLSESLLY